MELKSNSDHKLKTKENNNEYPEVNKVFCKGIQCPWCESIIPVLDHKVLHEGYGHCPSCGQSFYVSHKNAENWFICKNVCRCLGYDSNLNDDIFIRIEQFLEEKDKKQNEPESGNKIC
jgi:hypothetical protein